MSKQLLIKNWDKELHPYIRKLVLEYLDKRGLEYEEGVFIEEVKPQLITGKKEGKKMCEHLRRQGDNYGEWCLDCGEQLEDFT